MVYFSTKQSFRDYCKKKIKKIKKSQKRVKEKRVQKILFEFIEFFDPNSILLYMPLKYEVDIRVLFRYRASKKIFLPFMEGESFKMVKYRLPLKVKRFGIKEPANSFLKFTHIDLAIVPVIGVDGNFKRVGFGKGMYDRFFASLSYRPYIIFVEIEKCFTKSKICDDYDLIGDIYITPDEILIRRGIDVDRVISRKFCSNHKWRCRVFDSKKVRAKQI